MRVPDLDDDADDLTSRIRLPRTRVAPLRSILRRLGYALTVLVAMSFIVYADRRGYRDSSDGTLTLLDSFYYATVSLSTTGYGDIVPVSRSARLVNILIVTPLRVGFLAVLVGTTFEVLTQRTREELRLNRWRSQLRGHTVVVGYGAEGRSAVATLRDGGTPRDKFVVIELRPERAADATADGYASIVGDASRSAVQRQAGVPEAARIIVATDRDDTSVLVTLTARQLNPEAMIVAEVRAAENEPLLRQSGATAVITSAEAAGRLLGFAAFSPALSEVFEDLLVHGEGLELTERGVQDSEVGQTPRHRERPCGRRGARRSGHRLRPRGAARRWRPRGGRPIPLRPFAGTRSARAHTRRRSKVVTWSGRNASGSYGRPSQSRTRSCSGCFGSSSAASRSSYAWLPPVSSGGQARLPSTQIG